MRALLTSAWAQVSRGRQRALPLSAEERQRRAALATSMLPASGHLPPVDLMLCGTRVKNTCRHLRFHLQAGADNERITVNETLQ